MEDNMEKATSNKKPFIQFIRNSKEFYALIKQRPTAFVLLAIIADRARRTGEVRFEDCEIGEAEIGDVKTYNSSEQKYKTDKNYLEKYGFATFRGTNKGTVAKIISTCIFDINAEKVANKVTNDQRPTNEQPTTNKNDNNDKNDKVRDKSLTTSVAGNDSDTKKTKGLPNPEVDFVLKEFSRIFQLERPADKKPRQWAYHISRKLHPLTRITDLLQWIFSKDWGKQVDKLETIYHKIPIFNRDCAGKESGISEIGYKRL